MFTKLLFVALAGMVLLVVLNYIKGKRMKKESLNKAAVVFFVCIVYLLLVTKLAPYQVERYVMPLYPMVYLLVVGGSVKLLSGLISQKFALVLCILGFGGLSFSHILLSGIPYTYEKNSDNIERFAITEEYGDGYALYISDNGECHQFYASQVLRFYKAYYHVYDLTTVAQVKEDMSLVEGAESIIVYVSKTHNMDEVNDFVEHVFPERVLNEENHLDEDEDWNVYLLKL